MDSGQGNKDESAGIRMKDRGMVPVNVDMKLVDICSRNGFLLRFYREVGI